MDSVSVSHDASKKPLKSIEVMKQSPVPRPPLPKPSTGLTSSQSSLSSTTFSKRQLLPPIQPLSTTSVRKDVSTPPNIRPESRSSLKEQYDTHIPVLTAPLISGTTVSFNEQSAQDKDIEMKWLPSLYEMEGSSTIRKRPLDPWTSLARVHRLQQLTSKLQVDALLFICGIDGEYNTLGTQLLKHVFDFVPSQSADTLDEIDVEEQLQGLR